MKTFELLDNRNKMTKLVLLVLFRMLCFVPPILADGSVIASNGEKFYYENSPATFICKTPHAIWKITGQWTLINITECNCPGKCGNILYNKTRITAHCNGLRPVLHFKQMMIDDHSRALTCIDGNSASLFHNLFVGKRNDDFYPEEPFALVGKSYTLVCEKNKLLSPYLHNDVILFDDHKKLATCFRHYPCTDVRDKENFTFTSENSKIKIRIRKITLKDDGKIFGCYLETSSISLLKLTVNVPVRSVSLYKEGKGFLIEDETATFVCKVDESKPKASFGWLSFKYAYGTEITETINVTSKLNGKVWQTNSTLKLKLKRNLQKIQCSARILEMGWTDSRYLRLDVKYPPRGNPVINVNNSKVCVGEPIRIRCEWRGGNPSASLTLTCLSKTKTSKDSVTMTETVTQEMNNHCRCDGVHIAKNASSKYILNIQYYPIIQMPNRITVIENETMELDCISEGNPEPTISWKIGNNIINSRMLRTSFTRQNASSGIQCISIANSLKTVQTISVVVTYAPEITISYKNSEVECSANANPANVTYELVQKWGNIEKRRINGKKIVFQKLIYQDAGEWTCQASNGIPTNTGKKYSEKSVEVKVNTPAQFNGNETAEAKIGHQKIIKVCFYCHPEAISMEWHSERGKLSSDKSAYSAAEDGQFPFIGNCSTLTLHITKQSAKKYEFIVKNSAEKSKFSVSLVIKRGDENADNTLGIILAPMISGFVIIMIIAGGIHCCKHRRNSMKKKPARKQHPLPHIPKLEIEPTEDSYDNLKFDYENLDEQQKENEPTEPIYLEVLQIESKEDANDDIETHLKDFDESSRRDAPKK